ncbi:hypothetical protein AWV79_04670 [Cupriavidus sp. UYMMa02A]|nr:hypothetical protein AWV79_04670 [Cupriavidus sp. UYMMa02A]
MAWSMLLEDRPRQRVQARANGAHSASVLASGRLPASGAPAWMQEQMMADGVVKVIPVTGMVWAVAITADGKTTKTQTFACRSAAIAAGVQIALQSESLLLIQGLGDECAGTESIQ